MGYPELKRASEMANGAADYAAAHVRCVRDIAQDCIARQHATIPLDALDPRVMCAACRSRWYLHMGAVAAEDAATRYYGQSLAIAHGGQGKDR